MSGWFGSKSHPDVWLSRLFRLSELQQSLLISLSYVDTDFALQPCTRSGVGVTPVTLPSPIERTKLASRGTSMFCNQCGMDTGNEAPFCVTCGGRSIGAV